MTMGLLRMKDVLKRTGLTRTTLYRLIREGLFPKPTRLGVRIPVWTDDIICLWIESLTKTTDKKKNGEVSQKQKPT